MVFGFIKCSQYECCCAISIAMVGIVLINDSFGQPSHRSRFRSVGENYNFGKTNVKKFLVFGVTKPIGLVTIYVRKITCFISITCKVNKLSS